MTGSAWIHSGFSARTKDQKCLRISEIWHCLPCTFAVCNLRILSQTRDLLSKDDKCPSGSIMERILCNCEQCCFAIFHPSFHHPLFAATGKMTLKSLLCHCFVILQFLHFQLHALHHLCLCTCLDLIDLQQNLPQYSPPLLSCWMSFHLYQWGCLVRCMMIARSWRSAPFLIAVFKQYDLMGA